MSHWRYLTWVKELNDACRHLAFTCFVESCFAKRKLATTICFLPIKTGTMCWNLHRVCLLESPAILRSGCRNWNFLWSQRRLFCNVPRQFFSRQLEVPVNRSMSDYWDFEKRAWNARFLRSICERRCANSSQRSIGPKRTFGGDHTCSFVLCQSVFGSWVDKILRSTARYFNIGSTWYKRQCRALDSTAR